MSEVETKPNERGQWRKPPMPELMAERIRLFAKRWTKYNRLQSRKAGVIFVKMVWPDVELLDDIESRLGAVRELGELGGPYPGQAVWRFCEKLPRPAAFDAGRVFAFLAHRQWTIGRAQLAKRLLREHAKDDSKLVVHLDNQSGRTVEAMALVTGYVGQRPDRVEVTIRDKATGETATGTQKP